MVHAFPTGINVKVNVTAQLKDELAYFDVKDQPFQPLRLQKKTLVSN